MSPKDNQDVNVGAAKLDAGKIRMDLLPGDAEMAIAAVFTYGEKKYAAWNWAKGLSVSRVTAAMKRHLASYEMGEDCDDESGLPHTWHIGCCAMMLISGNLRGVAEDDRAKNINALKAVMRTFENDAKDPTAAKIRNMSKAPPKGDASTGGYPVFQATRYDPYNEQGMAVDYILGGKLTEAEANKELQKKGFPPLEQASSKAAQRGLGRESHVPNL